MGDVDRPLKQCRDILALDPPGTGGHLAIIGDPQSGRSAFTWTVAGVLALIHTPIKIRVYAVDFGGGAFTGTRDLTRMSDVALRSDETRVRRILVEIESIVDSHGWCLAAQRIESMTVYRHTRAERKADDGCGNILLVVNSWQAPRSDFDGLEMRLQGLIPRGPNFGTHVIATALRQINSRTAVRDVFGSRIELRLSDVLDSEIGKELLRNVPTGASGYGFEPSKHHILGTLP